MSLVKNLIVKKVRSKSELEKVINIRKKVFIVEQKVPYEIEIDGFDEESEHFLAYLDGKPIGCGRIRKNKDYFKLERIAILKEYRNKKYGEKITNYLISYCKGKNKKQIRLHSQLKVVDFYKKFGFIPIGNTFLEAGIKHIEMYKDI